MGILLRFVEIVEDYKRKKKADFQYKRRLSDDKEDICREFSIDWNCLCSLFYSCMEDWWYARLCKGT